MDYHRRLIEDSILERTKHYPVTAVLGARQVGKSTLIDNLFKERIQTVVFDPVQDIANARADPDFFLQNHPPPLFLDEIQYAPEVLAALKRRVDRFPDDRYIISGSQNLSVLRSISESLSGRVSIAHLWPLSFRESRKNIERQSILRKWLASGKDAVSGSIQTPQPVFDQIWRGGYPKLLALPDQLIPDYWASYMQTYIERDVRTVANIGSLQTFGRFFGLLAAYSAQEINHTQLGRELGVDRKTALQWTEIAEATYQWVSIPAYSRNAVKRVAGKRKGYFTDTGFLCYLQRISSPAALANHPFAGRLFKSWVVLEILKSFQNWPISPALYHYRSYAGAEVDLVLEIDGTLFPIEIKSKSNPDRHDTSGIRSFKECFPQERIADGLIICAIDKPTMITDNILAIPWWLI